MTRNFDIIGYAVVKNGDKIIVTDEPKTYQYSDKPLHQITNTSDLALYGDGMYFDEIDKYLIGYAHFPNGDIVIVTPDLKAYRYIDKPLLDIEYSELVLYDRRKLSGAVKRFLVDTYRFFNSILGIVNNPDIERPVELPRTYRTRDELPHSDLASNHELNRARKQKKITIYPEFKEKAEGFAEEQGLDFSTMVEKAIKYYATSKGYTFD